MGAVLLDAELGAVEAGDLVASLTMFIVEYISILRAGGAFVETTISEDLCLTARLRPSTLI